MKLTRLFNEFLDSEKASGLVLIFCTGISLLLANSALRDPYLGMWQYSVAGHTVVQWINDGLMAVFFLLIGLELEREIYIGELSEFKTALLPLFAAIGGMVAPAGIHFVLNHNTATQSGIGIPMATDIAFAIGILSLLGPRIPVSLKVFLTALAVIDDLGAIIVIALFYSAGLSLINLGIAIGIFVVLIVFNRLKVQSVFPYLIGGIIMWYFMLQSGVHATITGVLLAFTIPFTKAGEKSPSHLLQHVLHKPVGFFILPVFALANTAILLPKNWWDGMNSTNSVGISMGLVIGKPMGIVLLSSIAVILGLSSLPKDIKWNQLIGTGFLAGIGFTMSIFITLLAFDTTEIIITSKITILFSSLVAGLIGFIWLKVTTK